MVNTEINYEGHTFNFNSAGAIIIAIRPIRENGEKSDLGLGMYGKYSVIDAIEAIVSCTKEMFESYVKKDDEMDTKDMYRLFLAAVKEQLKPGEDEITLETEIDPELVKAILGQ